MSKEIIAFAGIEIGKRKFNRRINLVNKIIYCLLRLSYENKYEK